MNSYHLYFVLFSGTLGLCYLLKVLIQSSLNPLQTLIQLEVSVGSESLQLKNPKNLVKKRRRGSLPKYMLKLYHRRATADIVRALEPLFVSAPIAYDGGGRILEFLMPPANPEEALEAAELLGIAGMIWRVKSMSQNASEVRKFRKDEAWRAFDVTDVVKMRSDDSLKFLVRGKVKGRPGGEDPILLLSYNKPKRRKRRSVDETQGEDDNSPTWSDKRRRRNSCRKRSLYVDFRSINYDDWVVAPPGYDAYQCVGKCFFPFGDHLSPTKHAIVQALVHGALQTVDNPGKTVTRVCCVPTRLAPTSLLYLDSSGTLTYQYGYEDMVVVECGCR